MTTSSQKTIKYTAWKIDLKPIDPRISLDYFKSIMVFAGFEVLSYKVNESFDQPIKDAFKDVTLEVVVLTPRDEPNLQPRIFRMLADLSESYQVLGYHDTPFWRVYTPFMEAA